MFKNTKLYQEGYASDLLRGRDEKRPWNLQEVILSKCSSSSVLLDIGSGDARKLLNIAPNIKQIIALEPSPAMRELALKNITEANIKNIEIVEGIAEHLPFQDNSFDIVTCSLAPWNFEEVFKVLRPGGYFINETIGCEDKLEFKKAFGIDPNGLWRGQLINLNNESCLKLHRDNLEAYSSDISISNGFWNTFYTKQGLLELSCKL